MRQQRQILQGALREVRAHPFLALGFSFFWVWVWLVVQSSFLNSGAIALPLPGVLKWVVPLAAYGATFLIMGLLFYFRRIVAQSKSYAITFALITTFGVGLSAFNVNFPNPQPTANLLLSATGALLMGSGTACIHMEWGRLLGKLGPRKTIIHGTFGTIGANLLLAVIVALPDVWIWVITLLLPLACISMILSQRHTLSITESTGNDAILAIPWRFLITSFIQGSAFGILQAILLLAAASSATMAISSAGALIGAAAVFMVVFYIRLDFNQLIYQVGFVILAAGFALMATTGGLFVGGWLLNAIGYRFIDILMFALCAYLIKQRGLPTNWVFSVTTCALLVGQVTGAVIGAGVQQLAQTSGSGLEQLSVLMVFVILTGALLMSRKENLQTGWGMIRPGESEDSEDSHRQKCSLITDGFGLTPREFELFCLLGMGLDKATIAKRLFLSKETVKTHTRSIYRKADVHSHEELINLVSSWQKS